MPQLFPMPLFNLFMVGMMFFYLTLSVSFWWPTFNLKLKKKSKLHKDLKVNKW
uniref:ATP synthase F0 subunit 8 n=1 Tax=Laemobothrion tinnunculi TaxID=1941263 RepID=A0A7T1M8F9_9NEOP|nr:ATP synthase F0 subunit 8 [Laemobothrion tinnunculi]